jgi:hypothetical protein
MRTVAICCDLHDDSSPQVGAGLRSSNLNVMPCRTSRVDDPALKWRDSTVSDRFLTCSEVSPASSREGSPAPRLHQVGNPEGGKSAFPRRCEDGSRQIKEQRAVELQCSSLMPTAGSIRCHHEPNWSGQLLHNSPRSYGPILNRPIVSSARIPQGNATFSRPARVAAGARRGCAHGTM